ncbi:MULTISPECIES: contact-dependent growth inhibition system immunity protein [Microbulbifer]|uniref:contact-dependent growth inhibition system immunity protein n=1 Tax=Microbulbifer TaxID=48073 RepID=UPI001F408D94|nr:contact-dependent growth inhibition system immunity protein [Microbulbifer zhoushanensis]
MSKRYPALFNLLAGPFYQCWYEYDCRPASEILYDAVAQSKDEEKSLAINEINKIVSCCYESSQLDEILGKEIGCNYNPGDDGISSLDWLLEIKESLEKELKKKKGV